jgi:hypothetical protein
LFSSEHVAWSAAKTAVEPNRAAPTGNSSERIVVSELWWCDFVDRGVVRVVRWCSRYEATIVR